MDAGWRFSLGHATDTDKDFGHATGFFSYFAKSGYGDGPADPKFDDRAWRVLNLPHDWAVELPFDPKGSYSHGFKALGRNFPGNSVGWYRKTFNIPASDKGKRISIEFDGVYRDAVVWVNGFYLGREQSGYNNFRYDMTDYINWGGDNTVSVRVDATMEEGWFYEGAGIYRHVWLTKTLPLHIDYNGTFVTTEMGKGAAVVTARTTMVSEGKKTAAFKINLAVLDADGKKVASGSMEKGLLNPSGTGEYSAKLKVPQPHLWSLETPYLYKLVTKVVSAGKVVDRTETPFGIRTITFDANKGFFLNGKRVELKGTCNHQDHAGVGAALPDALQYFRIKQLKEMGCNAYRCSHNPPTPELLDACDQLGMLVLVENRLMGTSPELMGRLKRMILLDRNHPCVFAWSLGNEEWGIEGNVMGAQIVPPMQDFVMRLDPTRRVTAAIDSGWGNGSSTVIDVMGYNYHVHGNTDDQHKKYPKQPSFATEESTTNQTRGVYETDKAACHMGPSDLNPKGSSIEEVWKYYADRPYLGGLFLWTGFDYRGEETPFTFPATSSQYGVLDLCGFPKDITFDYLKAWWTDEPVLMLSPHWNWKGREGKNIQVRAFSNCDEVELFLNDKSLGKKPMPANSHLEWQVPYSPGELSARGYKGGKEAAFALQETTGDPVSVVLMPDRSTIQADGEDVSVVTVRVLDKQGRPVPTAGNQVRFSLEGPGHIIGVGNGDPSCHEPDRYLDTVAQVKIEGLKMKDGGEPEKRPEVEFGQDDSGWPDLFQGRHDDQGEVSKDKPSNRVIRGHFELSDLNEYSEIILYPKSLAENQSIYVNGQLIAENIKRDEPNQGFPLPKSILKKGRNVYAVVGVELMRRWTWDNLNFDPGCVRTVIPAKPWKRSLFNGLAQVIVQSNQKPGTITLKADSDGLSGETLNIETKAGVLKPAVP
jgi:beta-galactosidase